MQKLNHTLYPMETDSPEWRIAIVTPNTEKACERKLTDWKQGQSLAVETYVPAQRELHEWPSTGKRKWIDRVLCPGLLFIRSTEKVRYTIKAKCPYILHFLKDRAKKGHAQAVAPFAIVPDNQMEAFRRMVGDAAQTITIDASRLHVGSRVRIKSGSLKGLEGYLMREPEKRTRFCIKIDLLGYATMEIDAAHLEEVDPKPTQSK